LAAKGHLEVSVEHGRLLCAVWDRDSPVRALALWRR
jgi:hypothetical protein